LYFVHLWTTSIPANSGYWFCDTRHDGGPLQLNFMNKYLSSSQPNTQRHVRNKTEQNRRTRETCLSGLNEDQKTVRLEKTLKPLFKVNRPVYEIKMLQSLRNFGDSSIKLCNLIITIYIVVNNCFAFFFKLTQWCRNSN
jgi:hypothetical protein